MKKIFKIFVMLFAIYVLIDIILYDYNKTINNLLNIIAWLFAITFIILIGIAVKRRIQNINNKKEIHSTNETTYKEKQPTVKNQIYRKKQFLTETEKEFLHKLIGIYENQYTIQAQIPLRMIIEKNTDIYGKYANELSRYIDYGILDEHEDIIALIELQDSTHYQKNRIERDNKVRDICKQAQIPLIEIWNKSIANEELKQIIDREIL